MLLPYTQLYHKISILFSYTAGNIKFLIMKGYFGLLQNIFTSKTHQLEDTKTIFDDYL